MRRVRHRDALGPPAPPSDPCTSPAAEFLIPIVDVFLKGEAASPGIAGRNVADPVIAAGPWIDGCRSHVIAP